MKVLTFFFLSLSLLANDSFMEHLKEINLTNGHKEMRKYKNTRKFNYLEKRIQQTKKEEIIKSKLIQVAIRKGAVLIDSKTQETYITQKQIIANVFTMKDYDRHRYILSKNNDVRYKVANQDISILKSIVKLHEAPIRYTPIKKKVKYNIQDKELKFNLLSAFSFSYLTPDYATKLINTNPKNIISKKVSLTFFPKWSFPIKTGFTFSFEDQNISEVNQSIDYYSLKVGPYFEFPKFNLLGETKIYASIQAGIYSNLTHETTSSVKEHNINQTNLLLGVQRPLIKFYGQLYWGLELQREWARVKYTNNNPVSDSLGITISHKVSL